MKQIRSVGAVCAAFVLAAASAACGDDDGDADELSIEDVWARSTPEVVSTAAVYMTLTSPVDDALVRIDVDDDVAEAATMHETVTGSGDDGEEHDDDHHDHADHDHEGGDAGGGLTTMEPRDAIELSAGEMVELAPGGLHIMLEKLTGPLSDGDSVELDLHFEEAGTRPVTVEVRDTAPAEQ